MTHHRPRRMFPALLAAALCAAGALAAAAAPRAPAAAARAPAARLAAYGDVPAHAAGTTAVSTTAAAAGSYNGLALTPPMGWNDWYQYQCGVTQADVLANAEALVSSGLAKLGYDYVNLDDCWMARERTASGQLQASPSRFPNGIPWLAARLHAMGLKLGLYESFGDTTCQGRPGSYGHYQQDADTFASWGVDFLKFDYCGVPPGTTSASLEADYQQMSQDLVATGRHIVFSEELPVAASDANPASPSYLPYVSFSSKIANMWRVAPDETPDFASTVFGHLAADLPLARYARPGAWNDLDMLLTGNTSFSNWTVQQQQTQMSIWAEMASPLLDSSDLATMSAATRQILGNKAVIAVDQDPLGRQGQLVAQQGQADIVAKPLADGDVAVLLANAGSAPQQVSTYATTVGLPVAAAYSVSNLWTGSTAESAGTISATVPGYSAMLLRIAPLRGALAGRYAPFTAVSASAQVPPAYPGSQFLLVQPGQAVAVPASFTNDGRAPVTAAALSLAGPAGWVAGAPVRAPVLPSGWEINGTWRVTVPPGTAAGSYTLTATASYRWGPGRSGSGTAPVTIEVAVPPTGTPTLDQLSWLSASNGFGPVGIDKNYYGGPLSIHGTVYAHGLWVNSVATLYYYLGGNCTTFTADLGLDDSDKGTGAVVYEIYADGSLVYDSGVVTNSTPVIHASADVSGARILELYVGEGNGTINYGNADFGIPRLTCGG
jgi:alpha-galactosidase